MADDTVDYPDFFHIRDSKTRARADERDNDGDWDLQEHEHWWRARYDLLDQQGYEVRPRFRPDWKPSWKGTDLNPMLVEDAIHLLHHKIIDARRKADGAYVCIKRVPKDTEEISIAMYLSEDERRRDSRNHCVPVLDHFSDVIDGEEEHFLVMPLLRPFFIPPFFIISEVIDFMRQALEGLAFLHENGVAHRDYCTYNIMLDGAPLYPDGFHPIIQTMRRDMFWEAKALRRCDTPGVVYYIADFGISTRFKDPTVPRLVTGTDCQDKDVPELSNRRPYDPYPVDIFTLGNVFKKKLLGECTNLTQFRPLVTAMTKQKPSERPTISEATEMFESIVRKIRPYQLRWRVQYADDELTTRIYAHLHSIAREWKYLWSSKKARNRTDL